MYRTNDPSVVVAVAIEVPFTVTVAPDTGLPVSSITFPVTLKLFCEKAKVAMDKNNISKIPRLAKAVFLFIQQQFK
jgi:hypothetical protein